MGDESQKDLETNRILTISITFIDDLSVTSNIFRLRSVRRDMFVCACVFVHVSARSCYIYIL